MESTNSPSKQTFVSNTKAEHDASTFSTQSPISFENQIEDEEIWPASHTTRPSQHLLLPAILVCIPMILLCTALLAVVFGFRVIPKSNIFEEMWTEDKYRLPGYLLVNFSDTKIVFIASFLSTVAPTLAGCIMTLASVSLVQRFHAESDADQSTFSFKLAQQRVLSGFSHASYHSLLAALKSLAHGKKIGRSKALVYSAALMLLTVFMCLAVTVSDATLHMLTEMGVFTQFECPSVPDIAHGRGINAFCTSLDRVSENYGFPCTSIMNSSQSNVDIYDYQAESQRLAHNTSESSEIRFSTTDDTKDPRPLAYLIPKADTILPDLDYQANTFGVSAKCSLIPASTCNITRWGPGNKAYTSFNCSHNFWGTLGMAENISSVNSNRVPSPYLPLLALKPQPNLEYSFFSDPNLNSVYNPAGLNDSAFPDPDMQPTSDKDLPSTIYMAFAWRSAWNWFVGAQKNELIAANQTGVYPGVYYVDYFLSCEIAAYDVDYVWYNGTAVTWSKPTKNGTLLNMWQGTTPYRPSVNGGGSSNLQDINTQAAIAGTTISAYTERFSQLLSQQILATIGGYTSPRLVTKQQSRITYLIARVPKAALGALLSSALLYPVLGLFLLYKARRSLRHTNTSTNVIESRSDKKLTALPVSWRQRRNTISTSSREVTQVWNEKANNADPVVKESNRKSTAGIRFVLFGNAGVGPDFNHLAPERNTAGGAQ